MPIGPARMSLMEHLGELRMRLVRIVVVLLVSCLIFYLATPTIAQFMLMPVAQYLPANEDGQVLLNVFGAFDAFGLRFQIAFWASLVATAPFIILPPAFEWLTDQASGFATIMPEASRWVDIIIKFEIGFGFGFELPLIVFYLVMFNIISYDKLRKSWRYVYIGLLIFAAMVTPDASPVTMGLMFAALVLLYEASLLVARIALRKRAKTKAERAEIEAKEAEEAREELRQLKRDFDEHLWGSEDELAPAKKSAKATAEAASPASSQSASASDKSSKGE